MRRRTLLAGLAAGIGATLAGCQGVDTPGGTPDGAGASPGTTAAATPESRFRRQLGTVREAAAPYRGRDGIAAALEDGFVPLPTREREWRLLRDPVARSALALEHPTSLVYRRPAAGEPLELVGAGYSVRIEDHRTGTAHGPPDLFDDEGVGLERTEADNWRAFHEHPLGTIVAAYSNGDDDVDAFTALPFRAVFDRGRWRAFVPADEWEAAGEPGPGEPFDVDGDGEPEVLDHAMERRTAWDLSVYPFGESAAEPFVPPDAAS